MSWKADEKRRIYHAYVPCIHPPCPKLMQDKCHLLQKDGEFCGEPADDHIAREDPTS